MSSASFYFSADNDDALLTWLRYAAEERPIWPAKAA
jgi:hypothetical protein